MQILAVLGIVIAGSIVVVKSLDTITNKAVTDWIRK